MKEDLQPMLKAFALGLIAAVSPIAVHTVLDGDRRT